MKRQFRFDEAYYKRYYVDPRTMACSARETDVLAKFVCSYLQYLAQPVQRILDAGCGLGRWRKVLHRHFPKATYTGLEVSDYLCARHGWVSGSVVDYRARTPFDLVICQGVLQYLGPREAGAAIENLAVLCRGALYLEVLTREDWRENCDRLRTDGAVYLRTGNWYRRRLKASFINMGGGVFLSRRSPAIPYELERLER